MAITLVYHNSKQSNCFNDLLVTLFDLNHAGQESHFFAVSDGEGKGLSSDFRSGTVDIMNDNYDIRGGNCGVGRNSSKPGMRPVFSYSPKMGEFAIAFDGYMINGDTLRENYGGSTDADVAARFIADADNFEKGIVNLTEVVKGHFCINISTEKGEAFTARCPLGVRSLIYGGGPNGYAVVSESRALNHIGMERVRDICAGEIAAIDDSGIHTLKQLKSRRKLCSFLHAYYNWIDSLTEGIPVELVRSRIGATLARKDKEDSLEVDIAVPIPDSGKGYAEAYALEYGCHHSEPLIKWPWAGRSYDRPKQGQRDLVARVKMNVVPDRIRGKRAVVCDDSTRRGTQAVKESGPIALLRNAGAKEIHLRIGSPKNRVYCRCSPHEGKGYNDEELAANRFPDEEKLAQYLKVDSARFIEIDDFVRCITEGSTLPANELCLGCYTGDFGFLE